VTVMCLSPGKAPRSALHLDDSAYLAVLSTPIRTQWKGPPASRNLEGDVVGLMPMTCQPVATHKIKLPCLTFSGLTPAQALAYASANSRSE
jgi:hypothetical protein